MNSGIELNTNHNPLAFMLAFVKPRIVVNGSEFQVPWGKKLAAYPPGRYHLKVFFPWVFGPANIAELEVEVYDGHITSVRYDTAFFVFQAGAIKVQGTYPCPA